MPLKEAVIHYVISASMRHDLLGSLGGYLFGFLAWSEMYVYKVMYEALILTGSPILDDPRVRHEALNLYDTHKAVNESEYPQFVRYIGGNSARAKLERRRFQILFAVAQNLIPYRQNSNFVTTNLSEQDNQLVTALIEIHNREIFRPGRTMAIAELINALTSDIEIDSD
ncbi:hypothetical protein K7X08_024900 [Anisodus acutangulus]|uniref:Uncharacterized protein n=1 Tax=Anisodus acutangulus TaxID=402998 RepID=A0A9Q1MCH9_9SOLA|nr:hypothetical protein K7X08_024900 [Anisodus acutangulus]